MYVANEDSLPSSDDVKLKTRFQGQVRFFYCVKKFDISRNFQIIYKHNFLILAD